MIVQLSLWVLVAAAGAAAARGVVSVVARSRTLAAGPDTRRAAAEGGPAVEIAELLESYGIDPSSARVRHDPAAAHGLQWRVRARLNGTWCFGSGPTAAGAVEDLVACRRGTVPPGPALSSAT